MNTDLSLVGGPACVLVCLYSSSSVQSSLVCSLYPALLQHTHYTETQRHAEIQRFTVSPLNSLLSTGSCRLSSCYSDYL